MATSSFLVAEALLKQDLRVWIDDRKAKHRSYDSIARELWKETDGLIDVTGWTIRRWLADVKESA